MKGSPVFGYNPTGISLAERIAKRGLTELVLAVSLDHAVPVSDILGRGRTRPVAAARRAVMLDMRGRGLSLPEIGHLLGLNHTSVLYAVNETRRTKHKARYAGIYARRKAEGRI